MSPQMIPPRRSEPKGDGLEVDFDFDIDADTTIDVFVVASPSELPFVLDDEPPPPSRRYEEAPPPSRNDPS